MNRHNRNNKMNSTYVDFDYYKQHYLLGKEEVIDTTSFLYYATKATALIRQATYGKSDTTPTDSVKMCCCEIAEVMHSYEQSSSNVTSEKVGEYSVSYQQATQDDCTKKVNHSISNWISSEMRYVGV